MVCKSNDENYFLVDKPGIQDVLLCFVVGVFF